MLQDFTYLEKPVPKFQKQHQQESGTQNKTLLETEPAKSAEPLQKGIVLNQTILCCPAVQGRLKYIIYRFSEKYGTKVELKNIMQELEGKILTLLKE